MSMTIKELGEKYGFDQVVHSCVLEKNIEEIMEHADMDKDQPDYFIKRIIVIDAFHKISQVIWDRFSQIVADFKSGVCITDIQLKAKTDDYDERDVH